MKYVLLQLLKDMKRQERNTYIGINYNQLHHLSYQHQILPLIFHQIYHLDDFEEPLKSIWKKEAITLNVHQSMKTERFLSLYQCLLNHDLNVIVVKGIICRQGYPIPDNRPSNDEDLYVKKEELEEVKKVLIQNGMMVCEETEGTLTLRCEKTHLSLDIHTSLYNETSNAYGNYQAYFEDAFDHPRIHKIKDVPIYSLDATHHVLFLMMHFVKHFLHGGVGIRQVLDIMVYIENYHQEIKWSTLYQMLEELHILPFIINVFHLACNELDFDVTQFPLPKTYKKELVDYHDLLDDLMDAGIFGKTSVERLHSSTITLNASLTGKMNVFKSLFPQKETMQATYKYINKYPFLLPVAWANRIIRYATDKNKGDSQKTIAMGQQRVKLLVKYKLVKK